MTQTDQTQVPTAPETTISPEELAAFRAYQARIQRDQRDRELRDTYAQLVDDEIDAATDMLTQLTTDMATIKELYQLSMQNIAGFGEGTPQQDSRRGKMSEKRILVLR